MHELESFLEDEGVLLDVRSPLEYAKAHIPTALSLPLFTNEERALVGTCYKQKGKKEAIELGLSLVGPKLHQLAGGAEELTRGRRAKLYCFRGGMRSSSVAWLLRLIGINLITLKGGYKAYRRASANLEQLLAEKHFSFKVIAGLTGCGKTALLRERKAQGEQVLDLEGLANHRGSAFGAIGVQPSQEMFENLLYDELRKIPKSSSLFIEDESRLIGRLVIPKPLFEAMRKAPKELIERSLSERIDRLLEEYGSSPTLLEGVERIRKRLGGERALKIRNHLEEGRLREAAALLLDYYDRSYSSNESSQ